MRILLVNVPHPAIGSRIPKEQLPPFGLLCVGGPLIDDGHDVTLIDGEFGPMPLEALVAEVVGRAPDAVLSVIRGHRRVIRSSPRCPPP
jgi:anaerobic magnesium-protoporphyrin IX monomethyl ester cyclase